MIRQLVLATSLVLAAAIAPVAADETRYYAADQVPSPLEVAKALAGQDFVPQVRKRGVQMNPGNTVDGVSLEPDAPSPKAAGTLAVAIPFAFDSANLESGARPVLDNIAEGVKLLGPNARLVIEGHTDAKGTEPYNDKLSKRRADAVRAYLMQQHGIGATHLQTRGKGEREPLNDAAPEDARNRRVQFRLG